MINDMNNHHDKGIMYNTDANNMYTHTTIVMRFILMIINKGHVLCQSGYNKNTYNLITIYI